MIPIDESLTAKGYTPASLVPTVFLEPRIISSITIHHWGALGQTHDGVVDFFVNGPGQTSAHFVVSDGRINCLVSPGDAAWHTGTAHGNATSIGIECRPEATGGDYAAVAQLVAYLRATYGADLPLVPHRQWFNTSCPGVWDLDRINTLTTGTLTAPAQTGNDMAITEQEFDRIFSSINTKGDQIIGVVGALGQEVAKHLGMDPAALAQALLEAGTVTITPKAGA